MCPCYPFQPFVKQRYCFDRNLLNLIFHPRHLADGFFLFYASPAICQNKPISYNWRFHAKTIKFTCKVLYRLSVQISLTPIFALCCKPVKRANLSRFTKSSHLNSWWRHHMKTFSALLAICAGKFTGHTCIPRTKASDAELWCFLWSVSE